MKKKLLIFVAILLLQITVVDADIIWSDTKREDLKLLEEEVRYKFYKEIIDGEYVLKGKENAKYEYEDVNDVIYSEYGDLKDVCGNDLHIDAKKVTVYPYRKIERTRYMEIYNIKEDLIINDIKVFNDDDEIEFQVKECLDCSENKILESGKITIDLGEEFVTKKLKVILDTDTISGNLLFYKLKLVNNNGKTATDINVNTNTSVYYVENFWIDPKYLSPVNYSLSEVALDDETEILEKKDMCQEREIFTYRFNKVKIYYDNDYHTFVNDPDYIKSLEESKVFYKYEEVTEENSPIPINNWNEKIDIINEDTELEPILDDAKNDDIDSDNVDNDNLKVTGGIVKPLKINSQKVVVNIIVYAVLFILLLILIIIKINRKMSK